MARKVWVSVVHRPGTTYVKVTIVERGLSVQYTAKCYKHTIQHGHNDALAGAEDLLSKLAGVGT